MCAAGVCLHTYICCVYIGITHEWYVSLQAGVEGEVECNFNIRAPTNIVDGHHVFFDYSGYADAQEQQHNLSQEPCPPWWMIRRPATVQQLAKFLTCIRNIAYEHSLVLMGLCQALNRDQHS